MINSDMFTKSNEELVYAIDEITLILKEILKNFAVKKAVLFSSYAKKAPTSDIDLVIDSEVNFYGLNVVKF